LNPDLPARHHLDVGADRLADLGDLVDEGDLGGEEGVGGELDHLGAGEIGADDRSAERLRDARERGAGPVLIGTDRGRDGAAFDGRLGPWEGVVVDR